MTREHILKKMNEIEDDNKAIIWINDIQFNLKNCLYDYKQRYFEIYNKKGKLQLKIQYSNIKKLEIEIL